MCVSSLHLAVNANTWRNYIFFNTTEILIISSMEIISWITVCANPVHVRMTFLIISSSLLICPI